MPATRSHRPPAPYCEDGSDEDSSSPISDPRAEANVAIKRSKSSDFDPKSVADKKSHDGSDSGYSSKAGTSDTMSTVSMKKAPDLKINTASERERTPYVFAPARSEGTRSPTKSKTTKSDNMPQPAPRFQHPHGICWVCDQYGYHFDIEKEIIRPATVAPTQTTKIAKSSAPRPRSKEEGDARPSTMRRSSSSKRDSRPTSMYVGHSGYGYAQPVDYSHPVLAANGWSTPPNQIPQFPHYQYGYPPPTTPISGTYPQHPGFFDASQIPYSHPPEPFYGDNDYRNYESKNQHKSSKKEKKEKELDSQRSSSRDARPRSATQKSKQSVDLDRISMPPPPRPDAIRPIIKKAPTEYPVPPSRRRSVFTDDEEDQRETQAIVAKDRIQQSRPPSAFKAPANAEIYGRPRARKSVSYSTPSGKVEVNSSSQRDMPRRRTDPLEQRVADVEDYVAKTNRRKEIESGAYFVKPSQRSITESDIASTRSSKQRDGISEAEFARLKKQREAEIEDFRRQREAERTIAMENTMKSMRNTSPPTVDSPLTIEALKKLEQRNSAAMSDAGSVRSKQSSSRESTTGRTRASTNVTSNPRTHINMDNGISLSIPADYSDAPFDIMIGNIRFSMNACREEDRPRELKRIEERAPSEVSHTSRRSLTSGSVVSVPKGRDDQQIVARQKQSTSSSKRSSRAASSSRQDDAKDVRSIDYSLLDESYYLDYGV